MNQKFILYNSDSIIYKLYTLEFNNWWIGYSVPKTRLHIKQMCVNLCFQHVLQQYLQYQPTLGYRIFSKEFLSW